MRPLENLTVVSIEQAVAAPFATRQLADLGARVIKIERPGEGDFARGYDSTVNGLSSYFVWLNRSKESLTLDLKRSEAAPVLERLLARADVFVQNLAPGASARLGLEASGLRARHPRLIVCEISGFGSTGPYADRKAYDLLVQAEAGLVSLTGTPETPSKVGISIADIAAGMYAYSGILTALLARAQSGTGTLVEVSLFDALAEWMSAPAYYTMYGGEAPPRTGAHHASIAPYGPFRTRDGQTIFIAVQNAREWTRFCADVLGWPGLADDDRFRTNTRRVENRDALHLTIESTLGTLDASELEGRLALASIAHARMNGVADFLAHPQLVERDRWTDVGTPAGLVRALLPPVHLDRVTPPLGPVPAVGQHTEAILEEIGIDRESIAAWRREGVI
ncbi:MAG TPA: CaiB/BaiF CoA-transferase family protein [Vicinamibacterales bacterium]|nr:CaiB/BaiF CoA-transferase family protein [Vicinamibacterales bacterium]